MPAGLVTRNYMALQVCCRNDTCSELTTVSVDRACPRPPVSAIAKFQLIAPMFVDLETATLSSHASHLGDALVVLLLDPN